MSGFYMGAVEKLLKYPLMGRACGGALSVTVPWAGLGITDIPLAETDEHAGELAKRLDHVGVFCQANHMIIGMQPAAFCA